ncbi:MAG: DsrE family protein [Thiomicrorhabdus sp.]|jgi:intracellular sulfur oxidation DsrE/DsrF family protein|nr:DsrE family protein [Thiomicrorhabdus sp.]
MSLSSPFIKVLSTLLLSTFWLLPATAHSAELNNQAALKGITEIHTLYDIRKSHPKVMLAYLKGIETNYENLLKENVKPNLRIIFISSAVKFITTKPSETVEMEHGEALKGIAIQIQRLIDIGVKMEVCAAATAYFKVDNATLLPGIKPVRSGFISVMGWQAQGYSLVPVY